VDDEREGSITVLVVVNLYVELITFLVYSYRGLLPFHQVRSTVQNTATSVTSSFASAFARYV